MVNTGDTVGRGCSSPSVPETWTEQLAASQTRVDLTTANRGRAANFPVSQILRSRSVKFRQIQHRVPCRFRLVIQRTDADEIQPREIAGEDRYVVHQRQRQVVGFESTK
jgi:hypothetical protein